MADYTYPIDHHWSVEEMTKVINCWRGVERAYEANILAEEFLLLYQGFKEVVPSKAEEKQLAREFARVTGGYELYHVMKKAKRQGRGRISLDRPKH